MDTANYFMDDMNLDSDLQNAETYLRTIFNSMNDGIFIHDAKTGIIIDINHRGRQMYGLADKKLEEMDIGSFSAGVSPYASEDAYRWMQKTTEEGPQLFAWKARRQDGSIFPVEVSLRADLIHGKECIIATVRDMTERERIAKALTESEGRYRLLFENLTAGFALHEMVYGENGEPVDYRYISVNAAFEKLTGLSADQVIGKTVRDILPGTEDYWIETYGRVAQTGEAINFDNYASELEMHFETRAFSPAKDQFAVIFTDITERKQLHDALEKRVLALTRPLGSDASMTFDELFNLEEIQQLQEEFAHATGVASIITEPDGTPITAPSNFTCFCSEIVRKTEKGCANCYKSDAILGRLNPDGPTIQPCLSGGLWDAGASIQVGGNHIASWLIGQVRDETQTDAHMLAYAEEIGADKDKLLDAFHKVPQMPLHQFTQVARSLYTLANQLSKTAYQNIQQARFIEEETCRAEELRQMQKMEAVGQLAGGIAHDFNNILQGILGFSQLLEASLKKDSPDFECANEIHKAANRAADLTRQMLTFSRNQPIKRALLNLNTIVRESSGLLRMVLREKHTLNYELDDTLKTIRADSGQATQVIMNLAVNARDAMPNGGTFTVRTENVVLGKTEADRLSSAHPGSFVCLSISDTGLGMSDEVKHHLFEPFFTTKEVGEGTGLGLSVVYGIVQQNEGWINASSEEGKGSTFKIYLPTVD